MMTEQITNWILSGLFQSTLSITPLILIFLLIHKFLKRKNPRTWLWIWSFLGIRLLFLIPVYFPALGHAQEEYEIILSTSSTEVFSNLKIPFEIPETHWINIIFFLWSIGVCIYLLIKYIKYFSVKKYLINNSVSCGTLVDLCQNLEIPVYKENYEKIIVRVTPKNISPMILGYKTKYLFLPSIEIKCEDKKMILSHEITHLQNHDLLKKILLTLICGFHWFNPAVHIFAKTFQEEIEKYCDYKTVKEKDKEYRKSYADMLLFLIQTSQSTDVSVNLVNKSSINSIKERFEIIMNPFKTKKVILPIISLIILIAVAQIPTQCQILSKSFQNSFFLIQRMDGLYADTEIIDFNDLYYSKQIIGEKPDTILPVRSQSSISLKNGEYIIFYSTDDGKPFEIKPGELCLVQFHLNAKSRLITGLTNGTSDQTTDTDPLVGLEHTTGYTSFLYIKNFSSSTTIK